MKGRNIQELIEKYGDIDVVKTHTILSSRTHFYTGFIHYSSSNVLLGS